PARWDGRTTSGLKYHLWYHHEWFIATSNQGHGMRNQGRRDVGVSGIAFAVACEHADDHTIRRTAIMALEEDYACFPLANVPPCSPWGCCSECGLLQPSPKRLAVGSRLPQASPPSACG